MKGLNTVMYFSLLFISITFINYTDEMAVKINHVKKRLLKYKK